MGVARSQRVVHPFAEVCIRCLCFSISLVITLLAILYTVSEKVLVAEIIPETKQRHTALVHGLVKVRPSIQYNISCRSSVNEFIDPFFRPSGPSKDIG